MIVSEAPGKVILFGEHSVVYGYPALAAAISLKTRAVLTETGSRVSVVKSIPLSSTWQLDEEASNDMKPIKRIIELLSEEFDKNLKSGIEITIESEIKPGSGLGSSASVAVAVTGAIIRYLGLDLDLDFVNKIAYEAEKIAHGTPSGIDNTIATYGGLLKFIKKESGPVVEKVSVDKNFPILLVDTGLGRSTRVAVANVRKLFERYREITEHIFRTIGEIAESVWREISSGRIDFKTIGDLMNINHGLLNAIGVSNSKIEEIINIARKNGALGAKITGAGLGGYVVILPPEDKISTLYKILKDKYKKVYLTSIAKTGLRVYESTTS